MKERQEIIDQEELAKTVAEEGLSGTKFEGRSVLPLPGDTVIQRANTFTDVVGPSGATTTARFLYVEAHNKSTRITGNSTVSGPTLALSFAGADGVYGTAVNMARFVDTDPTPDVYMYHRQLIRLPADAPATVTSVRVATTATTGGAAASVETFPVTEWLGKALPPHVAGFKLLVLHPLHGSDREPRGPGRPGGPVSRAGLRREHAREDGRLPAQVAGDHVRHERHRRRAVGRARRPAGQHVGRDHGGGPGRPHPVHGDREPEHRRDRRRDPVR